MPVPASLLGIAMNQTSGRRRTASPRRSPSRGRVPKSPPMSPKSSPSKKTVTRNSSKDTDVMAPLKHSIALLNSNDPTFLFLVSTFFSVLFIEANDESKTLKLVMPSMRQVLTQLFDSAVVIGHFELMTFLYFARKASPSGISKSESLVMHWHLWNGIIIYTMMDGLNGAFSEYGFLPLLHERGYRMVDRRYRRHMIDNLPMGPTAYEANVARTVNAMEVLVYSWLSIMVAVGIATRAKWHKSIELVVLTMSLYGTIVFVVPDFLDGCPSTQPIGVHDCFPELTPFYFFYTYFGVTINFIWFLVPLYMIVNRIRKDFK